MDDEGVADDRGTLTRTEPERYRTPIGQFALTGTLLAVLLVVGAFASYLAFGFSAMCSDVFDSSDCGEAQVLALMPICSALAGAVAWGIGWARRNTPTGVGWAWAGVVASVFGLIVLFG